ncbi:MAG TPA: peptide chain release factor N(5)-glutamine methyltransferase [Candidatus Omnitrophota bacterium]|nr:peptide chain release factor N(5)-glutamine methyltransferase [Candidatus Omnitrophota bacterium]HPS19940.1 peptide chain release factor N(5)-glutamine methyltransferase [Candidatus Omnitrophota bacterium]
MREYSETVPFQYEDGFVNFMGLEIKVDPRVFIPRPETALLVEIVARYCEEKDFCKARILDMCTGSGAIALAIAKMVSDTQITAVDLSTDALKVAEENAKRLGLDGRVKFVHSNMFDFLRDGGIEEYDAIVSNPPYVSKKDYEKTDAWVKAEPKMALYSSEEGMDHINILAKEIPGYLKDGGFTALEIGYDQSENVKKIFSEYGFQNIKGHRDFNGFERVITGWKLKNG